MARKLVYPYRKRVTKTIPYGYAQHPEDPDLLEPIPSEINALRQAVKYVKDGYSYQVARDWLVATTERDISNVGFWKICKKWAKNKHKYAHARPGDNVNAEGVEDT